MGRDGGLGGRFLIIFTACLLFMRSLRTRMEKIINRTKLHHLGSSIFLLCWVGSLSIFLSQL